MTCQAGTNSAPEIVNDLDDSRGGNMLIINDMGDNAVNSDMAFSLTLGPSKEGTECLVAYGPGVTVVLAAVGDRPQRAFDAIVKGHKENWKIVDLRSLLGARPDLTIPKLVVPGNGDGRP
jgi:hypothetical protein